MSNFWTLIIEKNIIIVCKVYISTAEESHLKCSPSLPYFPAGLTKK